MSDFEGKVLKDLSFLFLTSTFLFDKEGPSHEVQIFN